MSSTSKNKSSDPGWKWNEQYQRFYRQEYRNGKWDSIWDTRSPIPRSVNTPANSSQSQSAAGPSNQNTRPQIQQHGSQYYTYGTQDPSLSHISTGLNSLSLVGRESSDQIGHVLQRREATGPSSSRQVPENRQVAVTTTAQGTYSNIPSHGGARPINLRTISANASHAGGASYLSQSMPASGSNRNGKQIAQGYTEATAHKSTAPNSQATSGVSANPVYKHAATSTEDDDILSNYAASIFRGTSGPHESRDPSFHKIDSKEEWSFFVTGRVFSMLMWQPTDDGYREGPSLVRYGERAYAKVYRFIIIKPKCRQHFSKCIRISTHRGQGAAKKGLDQSEHCMVYSDNDPPEKLPGETKMHKPPIHMETINPTQKLDPASRADLARTYPVEHNVKVQDVGRISKLHIKRLVGYVRDLQ